MRLCIAISLLIAIYRDVAECKTSFVKDLKTDMPFPPVNIQTIEGIPEGHLRPLGWQKKPDGKVREEKDALSAPTFHLRYVKNGRPVVMRQALKGFQALDKWEEDSYLKERFGKVNVTITVKKELIQSRTKRRMLFRKFLLDYMYENWYLSSTVHKDMLEELTLPDMLSCGTYKDRLTEAELWMSSGGTASLLHSHGDHNLHCVLDGRKDFIVVEPKYKDVFKYEESFPNSGSGSSPLDMDMINVFKFPKIGKTPWTWSTLWKGDCVYIPAGYLHQVRSHGRGISYTVQFAPSLDYESSDCKDDESKTKSSRRKKDKKEKEEKEKEKEEMKMIFLSEIDFIWAYSDGERHLSNKKLGPDAMRNILMLLLRDGDQLHKTQFAHFYDAVMKMADEKPPTDDIFHIMTPNNERTYVSRDELIAIAPSRLQHMCDVFNKQHERVRDEL